MLITKRDKIKNMLITKRDKILLKKAREIFGSIVKNAYIADRSYDGESKEAAGERLAQFKFKDDGKKVIDYDKIILVFTNNKAVEFTTNEAAWMEPVEAIEKEAL